MPHGGDVDGGGGGGSGAYKHGDGWRDGGQVLSRVFIK